MKNANLFSVVFLIFVCCKATAFEAVKPEDMQVVMQTLRQHLEVYQGQNTDQAIYSISFPRCSTANGRVDCFFTNTYSSESFTVSESEFSDLAFDFSAMLKRISPLQNINRLECAFNDLTRLLADSTCWFIPTDTAPSSGGLPSR